MISVQQGGDLDIGRRRLLDRWRANRAGADPCATVYNECIKAPLQQQTLVKPLAFQNVCAPQSLVPEIKCKSYFNEGGFITKPVSRTYVLKPTLLTRLKGFASGGRKLLGRDKASCGTFYTGGTTGGAAIGQTLPQMTGGYQLGQSNIGASIANPPLHHKEVFDETATIAKPIHRKYVFKPTLWTRAKNLAMTGVRGGLQKGANYLSKSLAVPETNQPGLF